MVVSGFHDIRVVPYFSKTIGGIIVHNILNGGGHFLKWHHTAKYYLNMANEELAKW